MTRVIGEEVAGGRVNAEGVVLSDDAPPADSPFPITACGGSRARFVAAVTRASLTRSHFVYDCGGMARAHGWLPFPRRPYLTFMHGIEVWPDTAHPKQVRAAAAADLLVCITEYSRRRAVASDPRLAKAKLCWLATEQDGPPPPPPSTRSPRVLIVARIDNSHYKGHAELISAWPGVLSAVPDAVLTIVGSGSGVDRFRGQAADLSLPVNRVEFRGFVPDAEMDAVWSDTRVFAMPSRGEGFGLVYIEAMRHGIPVVASVHDAAPEVNLGGETGFNVDLDRPGELAERLIELLQNPDRAAALGAAGRERWHRHFRYSSFRERFLPLLRQFQEG